MPYTKTSAHLNNCAFHAITPEIVAEIKQFAKNDRYGNGHNQAYKLLKSCFEKVYLISPGTLSWKDFANILKNLKAYDKQIIMGPVLRRFMYHYMSLPSSQEALANCALIESIDVNSYISRYLDMQEIGRYRSVEAELLAIYVCKELGLHVTFKQGATTLDYPITDSVADVVIYHSGSIQGASAHYSREPEASDSAELTTLSDLSAILEYFAHGTKERSIQGIYRLNAYVATLHANIQRLNIALQATHEEAHRLDDLEISLNLQLEVAQERRTRRPLASRPSQPTSKPPGSVAAAQPEKPAIVAPPRTDTPEKATPQTAAPHPRKSDVLSTEKGTATTILKPRTKRTNPTSSGMSRTEQPPKPAASSPRKPEDTPPARPVGKDPTLPPIPEQETLHADENTPKAPIPRQPMAVLEPEHNDYSFLLKCGAAMAAMTSILALTVVILAITAVLTVSAPVIGVLAGVSVLGGLLSFGLYYTSQKNSNQAALDAADFLTMPTFTS